MRKKNEERRKEEKIEFITFLSVVLAMSPVRRQFKLMSYIFEMAIFVQIAKVIAEKSKTMLTDIERWQNVHL